MVVTRLHLQTLLWTLSALDLYHLHQLSHSNALTHSLTHSIQPYPANAACHSLPWLYTTFNPASLQQCKKWQTYSSASGSDGQRLTCIGTQLCPSFGWPIWTSLVRDTGFSGFVPIALVFRFLFAHACVRCTVGWCSFFLVWRGSRKSCWWKFRSACIHPCTALAVGLHFDDIWLCYYRWEVDFPDDAVSCFAVF